MVSSCVHVFPFPVLVACTPMAYNGREYTQRPHHLLCRYTDYHYYQRSNPPERYTSPAGYARSFPTILLGGAAA